MTAGRHKIPTELKVLKGTLRPNRELQDEVKYDACTETDPPDFLSEVGVKEWKRILPMVRKTGIFTDADYYQLGVYCWCLGEMILIMKAIKETDKTGDDRAKFVKNSMRNYSELFKQWSNLSAKFGFTPADRTKIAMTPKEAKNDLSELFGDVG